MSDTPKQPFDILKGTLPESSKLYEPSKGEQDKIRGAFTFHPAQEGQAAKYSALRSVAMHMAQIFTTLCPPSRELSLAITALQDAVMWANAAIAINEPEKRN